MTSLAAETNVITVLRSAARELLPVIVEIGPERARFSSFIAAVRGDHPAQLVLEPIADALPEVVDHPFRIVSAAAPEWFIVAHKIVRDQPGRAHVDLSQARLFAPASSATVAVPATELLVLVIPGGLHGSSAYVFPVQRVGSEVCEIRSSVALEPGRVLERVEIVGDRHLLRRASAQVLETVPCYLADGSRSFLCRLSLDEEDLDARDQAHDLVIDPTEVRRLLEFAGIMRADGWYEAPGWGRGPLRFVEIGKDTARLELLGAPRSGCTDAQSVRIGAKLFAVSYEFDVRAIAFEQGLLVTALPLFLRRRRRHRRDHRIPVDAKHNVTVKFRNPITGDVQAHPVNEVSFFGLSFESEQSTEVFWRGLPLEAARLFWRDHSIELGAMVVQQQTEDPGSGRTFCSVAITNTNVADDLDMISLVTTLSHPHVGTHDGSDFAALHSLYSKAGLFGPHMDRNLAPIIEPMKRIWRTLHRDASDVVRTFVHGPEHAPDSALTVLRAWEHAWVAQHLVDTGSEIAGGSGRLQTAYLDYLVPRPDGRYLVFFIKSDNRLMNAYVRRFMESVGTPEAVTKTTVEFWLRSAGGPRGIAEHAGVEMRAPSAEDEVVLSRAAQRCFGAAPAAALSMLPGTLDIPDTRSRFERAGLERSRDCKVVTRDGELIYGVIEERSTPGMNLTWMLNATWILPIHAELDPDRRCLDAALQYIADKPAQSPIGERFLNLPEGLDADRLQAWGFAKEASVHLYVLTRAGLHRWFHYTASRFGELGVLAARRERRRAQQSGG